jgi:O86/O127-antigen biosynthesis beta-1,3-galactosyltransferase
MIGSSSEMLNREYPYYQTDKEIRRIIPFRNPMVHPALMLRKSAIYSVRGYKYGNSAEDYEMFIRMARNRDLKFHNLNMSLFDYRRHNKQGTGRDRVKINYWDKSGFLFTEFLRTRSLKYIGGMLTMHPFVYRLRMLGRKLTKGSSL